MTADPYADVWVAARPYLHARKNDVHIPLSYGYALELLEAHPDADRETVLVAILLHDIGWALVDNDAIFREGFGPKMMQSKVRIAHEREGAALARQLLEGLGKTAALVEEVATIIDGHDTRPEALSLNDELVKDADKLWRFSVTGVSVCCDWGKMTPGQYVKRSEQQIERLFSTTSVAIARRELTAARAALRIDLVGD